MDFGIFSGSGPTPTPASSEPVAAPAIANSKLGCWSLAYEPCSTLAILLNCDFSDSGLVEINLRNLIDSYKIDAIRSLYFYNDTDNPIHVQVNPLLHIGQFPAQKFGWLPVLAYNSESIFLSGATALGLQRIVAANVVMPLSFEAIS